ncbi:glutamate receptor [Trifolium pratense]|uniref:Glutamate receptor n=1 Tax=Trifolium pratense TaxID=57577 RepID=A0A2K3NGA4_TRIPR|nr:glutamate receptor [Trifolium pratense]
MWKLRNSVIFKGHILDASMLLEEVRITSWVWILCLVFKALHHELFLVRHGAGGAKLNAPCSTGSCASLGCVAPSLGLQFSIDSGTESGSLPIVESSFLVVVAGHHARLDASASGSMFCRVLQHLLILIHFDLIASIHLSHTSKGLLVWFYLRIHNNWRLPWGKGLNGLSTMGSKWEIEKFTGNNDFGLWKVKVRAILTQQKCAEALLGIANMPNILSAAEKTEMNDKALSVIISCLADNMLREVAKEMTVAAMWTKLYAL